MSYCPVCKLFLAPGSEYCPLCRSKSVETPDSSVPPVYHSVESPVSEEEAENPEKLTSAEKRLMTTELLSVSFGIILAVTVGLDIFFARDVSWSRFSSIALVMLWLVSCIPLILWGKPWLVYAVLGPSVFCAVFLWDLFSGGLSWFFPVGLPVVLFTEIAAVAAFVLIAIQKRKGLNTVGVALGSAGFLCAGIDAVVRFYIDGAISLSWSIVVVLSVIPVAGFFFYLHYRILRRATLRKMFRL